MATTIDRRSRTAARAHPIPMHPGQRSPIKHVFYIIKENRTYDQVFGDLPQGNGDPTLVQFGRDVTPNHHALAEQFVLLDNFYGPGDQSALGHRWCLQAYPSTWTHKYGNARNNQNPMLLGPTDAIYDQREARGLKVRAYGERGANTITPSNATWTDIYNDWKNGTSNVDITARAIIVGLRDIYHPSYPAARGPGARSVPRRHLPEGVRRVREERQPPQPHRSCSSTRTTPRARAPAFRRRARWWRTTIWRSAESSRRSRRAGTGRSRPSSSPKTIRRTASITSTATAPSASSSAPT